MKKILVIEDQESIRDNICEILSAKNFAVIEAEDGYMGLQLAQENLPDLILCDIMMPNLDGYGVLTQLRHNPRTQTIPFIFLTARTARIDRRQGMALGADDFITKPFTTDELLGTITARFEKQILFEQKSQAKLNELCGNITHALPHELNTPLNGILGYSQILLDEYDLLERDEVLEMLETIHTSGQRLYQLTQNFLLSAELELIAKNPERVKALRSSGEHTSTQSIITCVALQKARNSNREADLQLELQEAIIQIPEARFKKIVEEIVDNAFKFSTLGTSIHILGNCTDQEFNLYVNDCGRGMTEAQITNVGAYMQFERKLYEQQGSGLGLSIAKRLIELYGGKLMIESIPNQHTSIGVTLPLLRGLCARC